MSGRSINLSGFDEVVRTPSKAVDLSGFDAFEDNGNSSADYQPPPIETGLAAMAPKGLVSSLYGIKEAIPVGMDKGFDEGLNTYRRERDQARKDLESSEARNPRSALIGSAAPYVVGGALPGGAALAEIPVTAALGGIQSALDSRADLTKGEISKFGRDVGTGVGGGVAFGTLGRYAPKSTTALATGALAGELIAPGKGAVPGAAVGLALRGASSPAVRNYLLKKFNNTLLDVPESVSERYMANPERVRSARTTEGVAQRLADTLGDVKADTASANEQAISSLSKYREPVSGFEVDRAVSLLDDVGTTESKNLAARLRGEYAQRDPNLGAKPRPTTITRKSEFIPASPDVDFASGLKQIGEEITPNVETRVVSKDVPGVYGTETRNELQAFNLGENKKPVMGYVTPESSKPFVTDPKTGLPVKKVVDYRIPGTPSSTQAPPEASYLTERELHDVKRVLQDAAGDWRNPLPPSKSASARFSSGDLNRMLKDRNGSYRDAMQSLSENIQVKQGLGKRFGITPDYSGANESGFTYTDQTLSAIRDLVRNNKVDRKRILESLKSQGYGDLANEIQDSLANQLLNGGGASQGSRKAVVGANVGTALGAGAGAMIGGPVGGAVGGVVGRAVGSGAGAMADKYGPRMAKSLMDANHSISAIGSMVPSFSVSTTRAAIPNQSTYFLMQNRGQAPLENLKQVAGGDSDSEIARRPQSKMTPQSILPAVKGTQYERTLNEAAQRGNENFNATYFLLMNRDQKFRQLMEGR